VRAVLLLLLLAVAASAGPVPRKTPPDPLGRGYMGFYPVGDTPAISQIEENTPASAAGLKAGDVFLQIGQLEPKSFAQIVTYVQSLRPGTRLC
jgi:S1-C subfamily serine protease